MGGAVLIADFLVFHGFVICFAKSIFNIPVQKNA